jgi:hypothetical protein
MACYTKPAKPEATIYALSRLSETSCCLEMPHGGRCIHGLRIAAEANGYTIGYHTLRTELTAKERIRDVLEDHVPILVAVDSRAHWVTLVRCTDRYVWSVDSGPEFGVTLPRHTWREMLRRIIWPPLPDERRFRLYPVRLP